MRKLMKKSSACIFLTCLSIFFFFNSHAYEIIFEKTTTSPGCEGGILYSTIESGYLSSMDELIILFPETEIFSYLASIFGCGDSAGAKACSVNGRPNANVLLSSDHSYYLCNSDNKTKQFRVYVKLSTHDGYFSEDEQIFTLKPQEWVRSSKSKYLNKLYPDRGYYKVYASTKISISGSSSADDIGTVTIN